jgi:hypothetical protein
VDQKYYSVMFSWISTWLFWKNRAIRQFVILCGNLNMDVAPCMFNVCIYIECYM